MPPSEKRDIKHITRKWDEFFKAAVRRGYPFLELDREEVPSRMVDRTAENDKVFWKMLPSTITEVQIASLESKLKHRLPPMYRAYLQSRYHLFRFLHPYDITDKWNGHRSGMATIKALPCYRPLTGFRHATKPKCSDFYAGLAHRLFDLGLITIGGDDYERMALNTHCPDSEGDYEVVVIAIAFDNSVYDKDTNLCRPFELEDTAPYTYSLCPSFREFVERYIKYPD